MNNEYLGENLIFIISQPRSGSTLLQRILFGHPDIQTSAETWLMLHPVYALRNTGINTEYNSRFAAEGVREFLENYTSGKEIYLAAIRKWADTIYSDAINKNNKKYFLDKTPRYFHIIPELYTLFPKAKFIFLLRNPMAVLSSELDTYVKGNWPTLSVFRDDLLHAPELILQGIELLGSNATTIHYEKFVTNPEESIKSLCEYLQISFVETMLDYSNTPQPKGKMNDPTGIQQHTRPSSNSIDKWKKITTDPQSHYFGQCYLNDLGKETIERLGYNYQDIHTTLNSNTVSNKGLYAWNTAIGKEESWSLVERFLSDYYFLRKQKGWGKGLLSASKKNLYRILINIKKSFTFPGA